MEILQTRINKGFFSLHFQDEDSERAFVEQNDLEAATSSRTGIVLSFVGWAAIIAWVFVTAPEHLFAVCYPVFFGLYPFFIFTLVVLSKPKLWRFFQIVCAIANGLAGILICILYLFVLRDLIFLVVFLPVLVVFAFFALKLRYNLALLATLAYAPLGAVSFFLLSPAVTFPYKLVLSAGVCLLEIILAIPARQFEIATRTIYAERLAKEALLNSILPRSVAQELSRTGFSRPVRVESATILFSDFVHFTSTTRGVDPVSIISFLNQYFSNFDAVAQKHHVERLKTIGDGYMSAGGVPDSNRTHPIDVCLTALEMLRCVRETMEAHEGMTWDIRIGINTGSVTAGIVGQTKFSYDIWGEAVNVASRHESSGVEGGINVSKGTYLLTRNIFDFKPRGLVEIKGGEKLEMYELVGVKPKYAFEGKVNSVFDETYTKIENGELLLGFDI